MVDRVRVPLTNRSLLSFGSWPFTKVRRISETVVWVVVVLCSSWEAMTRMSRRMMSETVPYVLPSKGADGSPGALDRGQMSVSFPAEIADLA